MVPDHEEPKLDVFKILVEDLVEDKSQKRVIQTMKAKKQVTVTEWL